MITPASSLIDVAFEVCTALDRIDIDFVIRLMPAGSAGNSELASLGFRRQGEMYVHPRSQYTVGFPNGPMGVGDQAITRWETVRRDDAVLYVVSRTDCVRDRLAAFYFWGDAQSLYTALDVARGGKIDLAAIERWSDKERQGEKFRRFAQLLTV